MRVLGIDPGLQITGYGCVRIEAGRLEPALVEAGVLRFKQRDPVPQRLAQMHESLTELLAELDPDRVAIEKLYAHYKHPRTAVQMGHARGVILLAAAQRSLPITDLPSTEVKKSVTGNGHAGKEQIQHAVASQCGLRELPEPADVADAIAIALTCARRIAYEHLPGRA